MRHNKSDAAFLLDMLNSARVVTSYVTDKTRDHYERDQRRVEIIGEAARDVSRGFRDTHPEIPWSAIMKTRHILAHDYDVVNHDIIWRVATFYVPE